MRRIIMVVVVALVMAAMVLAMAMPVFAAKIVGPSGRPNCGTSTMPGAGAFATFGVGSGKQQQLHDCQPGGPEGNNP
jgi:hypothetical protein